MRTAAAGLLAIALLGGCSEDDTADPEDSSPPSASSGEPTPPDGESTASAEPDENEQAALTAYQGYWDEYTAAVSEEQIDGYVRAINNDTVGQTPLADYTALETQQQVLEHILTLDANGQYMSGEPERLDPVVTSVDLDADIPTAQITDCLDVEGWLRWDRETGEQDPFPEERSVRYPLTAELEQWEGTWRVTRALPDDDSSC